KSRCNGLAIQIVREQCRRGSLRASPKWEVTILLSPAEKRRSFLGNPCESKHKLAKSKRNAADRRCSHVLLQNIAFRDPAASYGGALCGIAPRPWFISCRRPHRWRSAS